jgi:hypothetical protein
MATLTQAKRPPLGDNERATLCRLVDFPALLRAHGVQVPEKRNGQPVKIAIRSERTPSCYVWAPGEGTKGQKGWTWYDYGTGEGGDALGYFIDKGGLELWDAVRLLADACGFRPDGLDVGTTGTNPPRRPMPAPDAPRPRPAVDTMPADAQANACKVFLETLLDLYPAALDEGMHYLRRMRRVLPQGFPEMAWHLPPEIEGDMTARLSASAVVEDLQRAGLMQPPQYEGKIRTKPLRLSWGKWAGSVVLIGHQDAQGRTLCFIARRVDYKAGDTLGKYLQQTYERGAIRIPFGLPTIYRPHWLQWQPAQAHAGDCLIVEGTMDALGAACLGFPALGLSLRLRARNWADEATAVPRMLEDHLPTLREFRRVLVMPDNDPKEETRREGVTLASRLVANLRACDVRASLVSLQDLAPDAPENCKDLADLAAHRNATT